MNGKIDKVWCFSLVWMMITIGLCAQDQSERQSPGLVIFFIEMQDFMCLTCLDSFLDLCRYLPPEILQERTLVVLSEEPIAEEIYEKRKNITLKKLQALFNSNGFSLCVCMDDSGLFREIRGEADILVFEPRSRGIKSFCLPLSRVEAEKILNSLWSY